MGIFIYSAQRELTKEIYGRLTAVSSFKKDCLETLQQFDRDRYNFALTQGSHKFAF